MATVIMMPRLSPTMEEGVLAKWLKKEGEKIAPGDLIAEVETDKANMDFPLEEEGVLLKQLASAGQTVRLGAPVAILGEPGEDISAILAEVGGGKPAAAASAAPTKEAAPASKEAAPAGKGPDKAAAPASGKVAVAEAERPAGTAKAAAPAAAERKSGAEPALPVAKESPAAPPPGAPMEEARSVASPLARRMAGDAGLDIRTVTGTGPGGRVIKRDIAKALLDQAAAPPPPAEVAGRPAPSRPSLPAVAGVAPAAAPRPVEGGESVPLSMMRRVVARRLTEAKQTVPHFYLTAEAPMDALWRFREELNQLATTSGGEKISVNDFILKALARALRVVPAANMSFGTDGMSAARHSRVDISVAVAMDDGLITPVVRGADGKSLGTLAKEVRELAQRGREKKLRPEEYTGGTFSLTNLGMYGIREFYAIINPPESGILAVGQVEKRAVVVEENGEDTVRIERRLTLTLSCDHRIVDGALGAKLMAEIVRGLSQPLLLVL